MSRRKEVYLSIIVISTIFAATIVSITLTGFGSVDTAQGQVDSTSLTPEQKSAMCDPNNPKLNFVNTSESHICGIPKTPTPTNTTTSPSMTTGTETPPSNSLAPSAVP